MKKEDIKWLKENEPWRYDDLFGDPVTGFSNEDNLIRNSLNHTIFIKNDIEFKKFKIKQ